MPTAFVIERAKECGKTHSHAATLFPEITAFESEIGPFLKQFEFTTIGPPDLPFENQLDRLSHWLDSAVGALGFVRAASASSLRYAVDGFIYGLDSSNYVLAISSARNLLERVAVLRQSCSEIKTAVEKAKCGVESRNGKEHAKGVLECSQIVADFVSRTRFNWGKMVELGQLEPFPEYNKAPKDVMAKNILTLIDRLPQNDSKIRFHYELLCEFVHPNLGAYMLSIQSNEKRGDGRARMSVNHGKPSEQQLDIALHLTSFPVVSALGIASGDLRWLTSAIKQFDTWNSSLASRSGA